MESRSIRDMKEGDFVKTLDGKLHEISKVDGLNVPKYWHIDTKDGLRVGMWESDSYYKKEDIKNE